MALFSKKNRPFIDVVRWDWNSGVESDDRRSGRDERRELCYAWRFPETNLTTFTQLIVAPSQEAVFISKGKLLGKFGPGKYVLNTENLPGLRTLFSIPFGEDNPFTAEVWFVNKATPLNIDWNTTPMMFHDPDYQAMIPLVARGRYGLRVDDAERFLLKLVGIAPSFDAKALTHHFAGELSTRTNTLLMQRMQSERIGIKSIAAYLGPLSEVLRAGMEPFWTDYGFTLVNFYVTEIAVDPSTEGKRILHAIADQSAQKIAGYTWQQSQAFGVADRAVSSGGGLLGAVLMGGLMGSGGGNGGLMQPLGSSPASQHSDVPKTAPAPREVFCSNCAKKFSSAMKFCPHCGDPYTPCPRCGADNAVDAKRCVSCGASRSALVQCATCRADIPPGAQFCPSCGKSPTGASGCTRCGAPLDGRPGFCPQCGQKATP